MLSVSRNGIAAANQELDVISNNIANAGTTGFKRSTSQFVDMYTGAQQETSAPNWVWAPKHWRHDVVIHKAPSKKLVRR